MKEASWSTLLTRSIKWDELLITHLTLTIYLGAALMGIQQYKAVEHLNCFALQTLASGHCSNIACQELCVTTGIVPGAAVQQIARRRLHSGLAKFCNNQSATDEVRSGYRWKKTLQVISNLTFTSRLLEHILGKQLAVHLESNCALPEYQSSYQKLHCTENAPLEVRVYADHNMVLIHFKSWA